MLEAPRGAGLTHPVMLGNVSVWTGRDVPFVSGTD
jgi:hypothetical protein